MGYRTLYAVYAFVLLEGILYGVHFWWVAAVEYSSKTIRKRAKCAEA